MICLATFDSNSFKKDDKTEKNGAFGRYRELFKNKSTFDFLVRIYRLSTFTTPAHVIDFQKFYRLSGLAWRRIWRAGARKPGAMAAPGVFFGGGVTIILLCKPGQRRSGTAAMDPAQAGSGGRSATWDHQQRRPCPDICPWQCCYFGSSASGGTLLKS